MITNEFGIHTFSLKLQCKYSEIQNIIEQNECIRTDDGKLGLSAYYQMTQYKPIGVDRRLKEFKLSRCDLTCNLYYERKADVQNRLDIFKKSFPIPHYNAVKFGKYSNSDEQFKGANKHSWTIENKSKSCAFSVYDKSYELEKRHDIKIDEHILRLELRFGRSKITKLTKAKDWESQLIELGSQIEKQQHKFLYRLHMKYFDPVSLSELLDRINTSYNNK